MNYDTIDLDGVDEEYLARVVLKIVRHGCKVVGFCRSDGLNGFHVFVRCKCGLCRFVFDDSARFEKDMNRPNYARNVVFQKRRRKLYLQVMRGLWYGGM